MRFGICIRSHISYQNMKYDKRRQSIQVSITDIK
jgi:hypothetical protein